MLSPTNVSTARLANLNYVELNQAQVDALVAIADTGSFEAAARALRVTPSAVSQRIRALESSAGQVLVSRGTPCRPTAPGERLVRLGRQVRLLHDEARDELGGAAAVDLPVAVNADSLATWFRDALAEAAGWAATSLKLHVEDQAYSQELLRRGEVLAAVTSDAAAVQGCAVEFLGALRYVPAASPGLVARCGGAEGMGNGMGAVPTADTVDWAAMPMLMFNDKDQLQDEALARRGVTGRPPVVHRVPSSADFFEAIRLGLGWGMLPDLQAGPDLAAGRLVRLCGEAASIPLYWQHWRLESPRLGRLTQVVRQAAAMHLHR
jgi:LysR family transcriptional regulator (chromosome initiation inhibitor)